MAQRLLAEGEAVLDVPAKLATACGCSTPAMYAKTDTVDPHAVAMVALLTAGLIELAVTRS